MILNQESTAQPVQPASYHDDPVAKIMECQIMGGPTVAEIEGRWKFLRNSEMLYTRKPVKPAAQEPALLKALQDVGCLGLLPPSLLAKVRAAIKKTISQPAAFQKPMTDEQIVLIWRSVDYKQQYEQFRLAIGRAIEAAHGITGAQS